MVFLAALQLSRRRFAGLLFFGFSCVVCVCGAGGACASVYCVCLWGSCWWRPWWCMLCARGCVCGVLVVRLGACPRLCGLDLPAMCECGGCVSWSLSPLAVGPGCGSPPLLAGVCCWWCVPPLRALPLLSLCRVAWRAVPLVPCPGLPRLWWVCVGGGWGGGVLDAGSGPFLWCFPLGGPMLALPVRV